MQFALPQPALFYKTQCGLMAPYMPQNWVNTGTGTCNGLLLFISKVHWYSPESRSTKDIYPINH